MKVFENYSFKNKLTFGTPASAKLFAEISSLSQLQNILAKYKHLPYFILGGGSNILFTKHFPGIVLQIANKGVEVIKKDAKSVHVKFQAGETWHNCVLTALANNWGGIENLSLIPGNAGAAPMQNIGAYGVELETIFVELEAYHISTGQTHKFSKKACKFGYRNSVFKTTAKGEYIIWSITLCLTTQNHKIESSYGTIREELAKNNCSKPSIQDISDAVIKTRKRKLPDPKKLGNAGSFFKNPIISSNAFQSLKTKYSDMPYYPVDNKYVKIPAGWLIEKAGWKGYKKDNYGVHKKQALVLVNYGNATGKEIHQLAQHILKSIKQQFDIQLQPEVNIYP